MTYLKSQDTAVDTPHTAARIWTGATSLASDRLISIGCDIAAHVEHTKEWNTEETKTVARFEHENEERASSQGSLVVRVGSTAGKASH